MGRIRTYFKKSLTIPNHPILDGALFSSSRRRGTRKAAPSRYLHGEVLGSTGKMDTLSGESRREWKAPATVTIQSIDEVELPSSSPKQPLRADLKVIMPAVSSPASDTLFETMCSNDDSGEIENSISSTRSSLELDRVAEDFSRLVSQMMEEVTDIRQLVPSNDVHSHDKMKEEFSSAFLHES